MAYSGFSKRNAIWRRIRKNVLTFFPHSHLEAFLEATVLTLIPMMLVDRTISAAPALVGQVSANRPLEEALAT